MRTVIRSRFDKMTSECIVVRTSFVECGHAFENWSSNAFITLVLRICSRYVYIPTRQRLSIVRRIRTWRWEDDLLWARMNVFRTSFYVPASVERNSYVRFGRDVDTTSFLRPRRTRTSGPNVGRSTQRFILWNIYSFQTSILLAFYCFYYGTSEEKVYK